MLKFRDNEKAAINRDYNPPDEIQKDRKSVYKRYWEMKDSRGSVENDWDKWEKMYEAWRPPKSADDWQSNIVPPFTTTVVERALAEIIDQTIRPTIVPRGPEDAIKARILNKVVDYTWEIADGDLQLYAAIKQALILGKTIWQEDYWRDKREVKILKEFDPKTNKEIFVKKEIADYDDVYGECINIRNFYLDPMAKTINSGRYKANDAIRRYIMNYDTFMESIGGSVYDQFGASKYVKPGGDTNHYQYYKPPEDINPENKVEVLWYWGRRPDKCIIVANDVVIRDGPNPYNHKQLPFAEGSDVPRLNQFWASGEPKLLESIQDEITTIRRMRIDRQHMDIWKMFLVSNRETLDEDEAIIAPSRFLYVDDPRNSIVPLEYRDVNPSAFQEEAALKQDGREVTGIESPQAASTATEAAIFKESTMRALRLKIWLLSRELVTNIIRLRVPNIVQYYTMPKATRVVGGKMMATYRQIRTENVEMTIKKTGQLEEQEKKGEFFFTVSPELITPQYGGFDYKLSAEPTLPVSKPLQQQKVAEFMQHPITQLAIQSGYYDVGKMADALSDVNDYDGEKFKAKPDIEQQDVVDEETMLEMANRENEIMMTGQRLPRTPYATRAHSSIHLAFMGSDTFKQNLNADVMQNFIYHIKGEEQSQQKKAEASQMMPGEMPIPRAGQGSVAQGIMQGEAKAAMPGRMVGNENAEGMI